MPLTYRRPGVYIEESLLVNPADISGAQTVAAFVGVSGKGPINEPTYIESWSDFVTLFGGFAPVENPQTPVAPLGSTVLSYLPYAVYSYFQNGGRAAYIIRSTPTAETDNGEAAEKVVNTDKTPPPSDLKTFTLTARSVGVWGNDLSYGLVYQGPIQNGDVPFALQIIQRHSDGTSEVLETFSGMSMTGTIPGTRRIDAMINDPYSGSRYVLVTEMNSTNYPAEAETPVALTGGVDPNLPTPGDLNSSAGLLTKVEGPIMLNIVGYLADALKEDQPNQSDSWVGSSVATSLFPDRQDIFIVNDNAPPRDPREPSSSYLTAISNSNALGAFSGDSYVASYGPWIIIPNPGQIGKTMSVPPGGAVMGMIARIDATIGVFRAPAGTIAGLSNAVGVQTKFTDSELGALNNDNINIIRSVVGAGMAVMGGRTRKAFGADKYISARRTLIYLKEVLRRSTQFAVFENNDLRLWSALRMSAERILRPLWEQGGLRGANPVEAYYIRCDETTNTPNVIQSGEVRMEVGVALQYPAEFIIIRITQFDRGTFSTEVTPIA
jgi:hypothetical protein